MDISVKNPSKQKIFNENFEECGIEKIKTKLINFNPPQKILQVRIPRTNIIAHPSLPKIKTTYLENNFFIEIYGREVNTMTFKLLCFHEINTQKDIQDIVIALPEPIFLDTLIVRGDMDNKNQLLFYASKERFQLNKDEKQLQEGDLQQKQLELESQVSVIIKKNYQDFENFDDQDFYQQKTCQKEEIIYNKNQIEVFDYKHLRKILEPNDKDEFLFELQLTKNLKESKTQVLNFIQNSQLQKDVLKEVIYYKIQLQKIRDNLEEYSSFKKRSMFEPCLILNNFKDDLKQEFHQVISQSLQGKFDYESETISGLNILSQITNESDDISKLLANKEFIKNFFVLCFKSEEQDFTLSKFLLHNLFCLLQYKEFRDGLLGDKNDSNSYAFVLREKLDFQFIIPLEKKDLNEIRKRKPNYDSVNNDDKKELKKKKEKKKKDEDDDWATSSDEEKQEELIQDNVKGFIQEQILQGKQDINGKDIELKNLSQLLIKKMLVFSNNPAQFNQIKDCSTIIGMICFIRETKSIVKDFVEFSEKLNQKKLNSKSQNDLENINQKQEQEKDQNKDDKKDKKNLTNIDYINSLENLNFYLQKIHKTLKKIIQQLFINKKSMKNTKENIDNDFKTILSQKNDFYESLLTNHKKQQNVFNKYLSKILKEENLLEILILILNTPTLHKSIAYNQILKKICNIIYLIFSQIGGVNFFFQNFKLLKDLSQSIKINLEKSSFNDKISPKDLNKFKNTDHYLHGSIINFNLDLKELTKNQEDQIIDISTCIKLKKLFYLIEYSLQTYDTLQKIYKGFHAPEKRYELLQYLCDLDQMTQNNLLNKQAIYMVLKEPYMFEILILLINISSFENYDQFQNEISITLKIISNILLFDNGNLLVFHHQKIIQALQNIRIYQREFTQKYSEHIYEAGSFEIEQHLYTLEKLTHPLQDMKQNFNIFINILSRHSRYIILDISTYLKKDFKFNSLIEPVFPFGNKKLSFQKLNLYFNHFKTFTQKESPIFYILGTLKVFNLCISMNKTFFTNIIQSNIFDIIDFICQVSEFIITLFQEKSDVGRQVRKIYSEQIQEIFSTYFQLAENAINLMKKKIIFKDLLLVHSQEYENVNLFLSVLRLLQFFGEMNPSYFFELSIEPIFEMKKFLQQKNIDEKIPIKQLHILKALNQLQFLDFNSQTNQYLNDEMKSKCNEIILHIITMLKYWAKFPGSFQTIVSETIFSIFNTPHQKYIYFMVLAILITEPRKIRFVGNSKESFFKHFKPLFFENVKTKKKSTLVLIQKYGACRSDSQFDLFITKNGYHSTIEYFLNTFVFESQHEEYLSFFFLVSAFIEWKDFEYCEKIYKQIEKILEQKLNEFKLTYQNNSISPKIQVFFKNFSRIFNFCYLLSTGGIFKKILISDKFLTISFQLFQFFFEQRSIQEKYQEQMFQVQLEFMNLMKILLDPEVGFHFKQTVIAGQKEKLYTEVVMSQDIEQFLKEILLISLQPTDNIMNYFIGKNHQLNEIQNFELEFFSKNLNLMSKITQNPKGLNEFFQIIGKETNNILQIQCLKGFFQEILNSIKNYNFDGQIDFLGDLLICFNDYIQTIFNCCVDHEKEKQALYKNRKNLIKNTFFSGHKVTHCLKTFQDAIKTVQNIKKFEENIFTIQITIKSIIKFFDKKSSQNKEHYENHQYKAHIKKTLEDYNKTYFLYEHNLNEFLDKKNNRFQNYNVFDWTIKILQNKFSKTMLPQNFFKQAFLNNPQYLLQYKYRKSFLDISYEFQPILFNDENIYPQPSNILLYYPNLIQKEHQFLKSINFHHPQQIVRNLTNRDSRIRTIDISQQKPMIPTQQVQDQIQDQNQTEQEQMQMMQNYQGYQYYQEQYDQQAQYGNYYQPDASQQAYYNMYNQMMLQNTYYGQEINNQDQYEQMQFQNPIETQQGQMENYYQQQQQQHSYMQYGNEYQNYQGYYQNNQVPNQMMQYYQQNGQGQNNNQDQQNQNQTKQLL